MQATSLRKEHARYHVKAYRKAYKRYPNNTYIKDNFEHGARPYGVCWLKPYEPYKVNELSLRGVVLVESADARKYN